ncbi:MAG: hypothetical protein LBG96_08645, partial [Tannerella sp.]|nr:hypothetical protein [Tannerella sp.]
VHFPTDYNLLWDCARKSLDMISGLEKKYGSLSGWRKTGHFGGRTIFYTQKCGKRLSSHLHLLTQLPIN